MYTYVSHNQVRTKSDTHINICIHIYIYIYIYYTTSIHQASLSSSTRLIEKVWLECPHMFKHQSPQRKEYCILAGG